MMITFPLWYKIFLGWSGFLVITGTARQLSKNKAIDAIKKSPADKIEKLTMAYYKMLKFQKLFFLASPLNLILVPYLIYVYSNDDFFHITTMLLICYLFVMEDFFFRRSVVRKISITDNKT